MSSVLVIFNQAIGACGSKSVILDPEENSPEANICRTFYEQSLTSTLQMGWWNFTQRHEYAALYAAAPGTPEATAENSSWLRTDPPPPWLYAYTMPSDIIQVRTVTYERASRQFAGPQKFRSLTMYDSVNQTYVPVIVTNAPKAIIMYTANVRDVAVFDGQFVDALVSRLAFDICLALTGDLKIYNAKSKVWQQMQAQALASDANEGLGFSTFTPESLVVRGYVDPNDPSLYIPHGVVD